MTETPSRSPQEIILELVRRVEAGDKLTRDEVRLGLDCLRQNRMTAATKPKAAKAAPPRSSAELLKGLLGATTGDAP